MEYKAIHSAVWPDVLDALRRHHIADYSIHYYPPLSLLIANFKYTGTDYEADMKAIAEDEVTRRWWKLTDLMQESLQEGAVGSGNEIPWWTIQLLSDLHLEVNRPEEPSYSYNFPAHAKVLALLGDIGCAVHDELFTWLRCQLQRFVLVFFVMGNHEPYGLTIDDAATRFRAFELDVSKDSAISGRFVFLHRTRFDVSSSLTILGCTLWSALDPDQLDVISTRVKDFGRIESFDSTTFLSLHQKDVAWLQETVARISHDEPSRDVIIFTHHAPTSNGTGDPKFEGQPTSSAFATELLSQGDHSWRTERSVKMWAFGHTHWCCDFIREGIRVYSNQRGYGGGKEGYNPEKILTFPES